MKTAVKRRFRKLLVEGLEDRRVMAFAPGNIAILRVGDSAALSNAATAVFIDEYTATGSLVQTIAVPTADSGANQTLTNSGTATSEGQLTRSGDGQYLVFAGYDAAVGTASIASSATTTVPRTIGRIGADGLINTSTTTTSFSGNNIRGATTLDGTGFWSAGAATGIVYTPLGGSGAGTIVASNFTNNRVPNIFDGQLYVSSGSGTLRLGKVGTGTPTATGSTIASLPGLPTTGYSPYSYFFADLNAGVSGVDTLYVAADDVDSIRKYSLVGSTWTLNNEIVSSGADYRGLTGSVSGSTVTLFATRDNGTAADTIVSLVDATGYNANITATPTVIVTASSATNRAFRGVALTPVSLGGDTTPPTVTSIDDGDSDNNVLVNATLTYTVSFNEDIDSATVSSADFNNAGTAAITVGTITETSPGVFSVQVTPTTAGSLTLRIPTGAEIKDVAGNSLVVPVSDNDTITVSAADTTPPTVTSVDDGDTDNIVITNTLLTYTVVFSEDIDSATVTSADFDNAGTAAITIGSITETTPGTFAVQVTPTTAGTLTFRVLTGGVIKDVAGNDLAVGFTDNDTLTVNAPDVTPPALVSITDNVGGGPIFIGHQISYTVTFNEDIDSTSVSAADFNNAGTATISVGAIVETAPGVFTVAVNVTSAGTVILRIPTGAVISDVSANNLVVPVQDDTTITVNSSTLVPGDISFVAFQSDSSNTVTPASGGANGDFFEFVALKDLPVGTTIFFTDGGYFTDLNAFGTNENGLRWVAQSAITAGTKVSFVAPDGPNGPASTAEWTGFNPATGASTTTAPFGLSTGGDSIAALVNPVFGGTNAFVGTAIAGIQFGATTYSSPNTSAAGTTNTTGLPAGLTDGTNAVSVGNLDNGRYDPSIVGSTETGTASVVRTSINTDSNWETSETPLGTGGTTAVFTITSGESPVAVSTFTTTNSGFDVVFSRAFDPAVINLYDQAGVSAAADVVLTGATVGDVPGTLVFNSTYTGFTFIKAGTNSEEFGTVGTLEPDTYTVTLRSAADGFVDTNGNLLRDNSGSAAGNYVGTFTVAAPASGTITVSIPDFARGADQAINVPNTSLGLPVVLSNGNDVGGVELKVTFDPTLISITNFTTSIPGASALINTSVAGEVRVTVSTGSTTGFQDFDGELVLGTFTATVPTGAAYGAKEILRLSGFNSTTNPTPKITRASTLTTIPSLSDNAVHLATFVGDLNLSQDYDTADTILLQRYTIGANSGVLAPLQSADPLIVGDINKDVGIDNTDVILTQRLQIGTSVPSVPDLPETAGGNSAAGPDPRLYIPTNLTATVSGTVTVPVRVEVTEATGIDLAGISLALSWDSTKLAYSSFTLGSTLSSAGFSGLAPTVSNANPTGALRFASSTGGAGTGNLSQGTDIVLVNFVFNVLAGAASGATTVNLRNNSSGTPVGAGTTTRLTNFALQALTLVPAPTAGTADAVDGVVTISGGALASPTLTVTAPNAVYSGVAYAGAGVTITGANSPTPTTSFTYYVGTGTGGTNLGSNAPINVGTYTVVATSAANASNNAATSAPVTFQITPKSLTATAVAANKIYDATTLASITYSNLAGFVGTETLTVNPGTGTFAQSTVGNAIAVTASAPVLVSGTGLASNYSLATPSGLSANITKRALTIGGLTAAPRQYNGSTDATAEISGTPTLVGAVGGDTVGFGVNFGVTYAYDTKNVGTNKPITQTGLVLNTATNVNYSLNSVLTVTGTITGKTLTATSSAANKIYDGNTTAVVTIGLVGVVSGEIVNASATGTFANKNVGTAKTVTVGTVTLSGADFANYTVPTAPNTTANITAKTLTATSSAANKVYDGNTTAIVTVGLVGAISGDDVSGSATGTFVDKNVGTAKPVTVGVVTLSGVDQGNYTVPTAPNTAADITAKSLTATTSAANKIYDGNTNAVVTIALVGVVSGDVVNAVATGTFADKNVGIGKSVSVGAVTLSGADFGNYVAPTAPNTSATITPKGLTITADAKSKTVGSSDPAWTFTGSGFVSGETAASVVTGSLTRTAGESIGTYPITIGTLSAGSNYDVNFVGALFTIVALPNVSGPVLVNGGQLQRSQLTSITVNFNTPVQLGAGAITIGNVGLLAASSAANLASSQLIISPSTGLSSSFTITFDTLTPVSAGTISGGVVKRTTGGNSLADGTYQLKIDATKVTTADSVPMAADFNFGTAQSDNFFRMYGDANGDGVISGSDLTALRLAIASYNSAFDWDGNGSVSSSGPDYTNFVSNYGKRRRSL